MDKCGTEEHQAVVLHDHLTGEGANVGVCLGVTRDPRTYWDVIDNQYIGTMALLDAAVVGKNTNNAIAFQHTMY